MKTIWEEIEHFKADPYFIWWILAFTGFIGSRREPFLTRKETIAHKRRLLEEIEKKHISQAQRKLIQILAAVSEKNDHGKGNVSLSKLCQLLNRDMRAADRITPRKAGSILNGLGIKTKIGAQGYTYVIYDKDMLRSLQEKAECAEDSDLRQSRKQARRASKYLSELSISSSLFMLEPAGRNPKHRPVQFQKYLAIHYLRVYFKKCTGQYQMKTIKTIMKLASAVEELRTQCTTNNLTGCHGDNLDKLNYGNIMKCYKETGIDEHKFCEIMACAGDDVVKKIHDALLKNSAPVSDWNRRPKCIKEGVYMNGNELLTVEQHLSWYERNRDKVHESLERGMPISSLWGKPRAQ